MTFNNIFKSSFLEKMSDINAFDMVIAITLSFCIGLFIFFIYKETCQTIMYSSNFGMTLIALTMITSFLILAVTSNVVLSLGMVGALSIVRFRTAIKEPLEIAFLFWAIAAGIVLAAGLIMLAVLGSVMIGIVLLLFANRKTFVIPYIVVLRLNEKEKEEEAVQLLKKSVKKCAIKSKTVTKDMTELNLDVRLQGENTDFINELVNMKGVESAVLVSYNGNYMG